MTEGLVKQSIAELQDLVRCRCRDAYKVRGLHDPGCECDSADAVQVVADRIEELEADLRKMALDYLAAQGQASENFQMYVDANEARIDAEAKLSESEALLEKAVEALEGWVNVYTHCFIEEGVCCCGEDMNNHTSQHMPMDHGAYIAAQLGQFTTTTLAELKGEK